MSSVKDIAALSKSKSQESELTNRIDNFIVETQTEIRLEPGIHKSFIFIIQCD